MEEKEKNNAVKELKKKLFLQRENGHKRIDDEEEKDVFDFAEEYKNFIDTAKTEREAAAEAIRLLEANGYVEYKKGMKLSAGDKIYRNNRGKAVLMAIIGTAPIGEGVKLCAAHIDSPRLDLKQNPLARQFLKLGDQTQESFSLHLGCPSDFPLFLQYMMEAARA